MVGRIWGDPPRFPPPKGHALYNPLTGRQAEPVTDGTSRLWGGYAYPGLCLSPSSKSPPAIKSRLVVTNQWWQRRRGGHCPSQPHAQEGLWVLFLSPQTLLFHFQEPSCQLPPLHWASDSTPAGSPGWTVSVPPVVPPQPQCPHFPLPTGKCSGLTAHLQWLITQRFRVNTCQTFGCNRYFARDFILKYLKSFYWVPAYKWQTKSLGGLATCLEGPRWIPKIMSSVWGPPWETTHLGRLNFGETEAGAGPRRDRDRSPEKGSPEFPGPPSVLVWLNSVLDICANPKKILLPDTRDKMSKFVFLYKSALNKISYYLSLWLYFAYFCISNSYAFQTGWGEAHTGKLKHFLLSTQRSKHGCCLPMQLCSLSKHSILWNVIISTYCCVICISSRSLTSLLNFLLVAAYISPNKWATVRLTVYCWACVLFLLWSALGWPHRNKSAVGKYSLVDKLTVWSINKMKICETASWEKNLDSYVPVFQILAAD